MPDFVTVLVSDSQPLSNVRGLLSTPDRIVIVTRSIPLTRHALSTMLVAVWVCDVSMPGMDLKSMIAVGKCANPALRIVFTGDAAGGRKIANIVRDNDWAIFVPRPWKVVELRSAVADQVRAFLNRAADYQRDSSKRVVMRRGSTSLILPKDTSALPTISLEAGTMGPDPRRYSLVKLIGTGGTGRVFLARDTFLGMDVAIKVVHPEILDDPDVLTSFKDEARITMQLSHEGILKLYSFNTYHGCYYMVMEVISGQTLRDIIAANGPLSPEETVRVLLGCAGPMDYAHSHNVAHNDLKTENIIITPEGGVKIIDFGTATLKNRIRALEYIVGTPEYMSPEQLRGDAAGSAGDIYAFGIITYTMLTACFPFKKGTTVEDFLNFVRPNFVGIPAAAAAVLEKATAENPQDRYKSVADLAAAIADSYGVKI